MQVLRWLRRSARNSRDEAESSAAPVAEEPVASGGSIVMYTTPWCADCRRAKRVFAALGIPYTEVDIAEDDDAAVLVQRLNGGYRSVPTIIFPDGSRLVEPSVSVLEAHLRSCCLCAS
jgi:mycoredoxin